MVPAAILLSRCFCLSIRTSWQVLTNEQNAQPEDLNSSRLKEMWPQEQQAHHHTHHPQF
jgi:hypothetical protein